MNPWQRDIARRQRLHENRDWDQRAIPQDHADYWNTSPWQPVEPQIGMPGRVIHPNDVSRDMLMPPRLWVDDQGGPRGPMPQLPSLGEYRLRQQNQRSPFHRSEPAVRALPAAARSGATALPDAKFPRRPALGLPALPYSTRLVAAADQSAASGELRAFCNPDRYLQVEEARLQKGQSSTGLTP